jgi:hypothetical protein
MASESSHQFCATSISSSLENLWFIIKDEVFAMFTTE